MPTTQIGRREPDKGKLPMEETRTLGYGIASMMFEQNDDALIQVLEVVEHEHLHPYIDWAFRLIHNPPYHHIEITGSIEAQHDEMIVEKGYTNRIREDGDVDREGALIVRDILGVFEYVSNKVYTRLTFIDPEKTRKFENAAFYLSMVPI
jgi:hypothetical protein